MQAARSSRLLRGILVSCVAATLISAPGCEALKVFVGDMDKPSASLVGVHLEDLTIASATLLLDVEVSNPYAIDLPLANLEYTLSSRGRQFLSGKANVTGSIPAHSSRSLPVPARVSFLDLLKTLENVKTGSVVPYVVNLAVSLDVPGGKPLVLPLQKEGELPIPAVPEVALEGVQWEDFSLEKATALLKLHVTNRNEFPVDLSKLSYGLTLGSARIGESNIEHAAAFSAGGDNTLEVRASFAPKDLGLAAFTVLQGKGSSYKLGGTMNVKTRFGPLDLPYERSGETIFKR